MGRGGQQMQLEVGPTRTRRSQQSYDSSLISSLVNKKELTATDLEHVLEEHRNSVYLKGTRFRNHWNKHKQRIAADKRLSNQDKVDQAFVVAGILGVCEGITKSLQADQKKDSTENNFMKPSNMSKQSKLNRSFDSKLGNFTQHLCREMAIHRFGQERVLNTVCADNVSSNFIVPENGTQLGTTIYTAYSEEMIDQKVDSVMSAIKHSPTGENKLLIGSQEIEKLLKTKIVELNDQLAVQKEELEIHKYHADLIVDGRDGGIFEIKAGGNLDISKAEGEARDLLRAYFAYGKKDLPVNFACLYNNRGSGERIKTNLYSFFSDTTAQSNKSGLLIEEQWWNKMLPETVPFSNFKDQWQEIANQYFKY
jgi:hypothetical protein